MPSCTSSIGTPIPSSSLATAKEQCPVPSGHEDMQGHFKPIKAVFSSYTPGWHAAEIAALLLQATGGDLSGNLRIPRIIVSNIITTASTMAHIIASGEKPQLEVEPHPVLRVPSSLKAETST